MALLSEEYYEELAAEALDGSAIYLFARPAIAPLEVVPVGNSSISGSFRETMRVLASGVVLITTEIDGRPWGVTVTSCCSLSVDPPRILVSLMRNTATCQAIEAGAVFGVDLLGDAHKRVAQFGAARGVAKFLDDPMVVGQGLGTAAPMVEGALSHVDCEVDEIFDGGDHAIILGRVIAVVSAHPNSSGSPLLYFDGGFHHLGSPL